MTTTTTTTTSSMPPLHVPGISFEPQAARKVLRRFKDGDRHADALRESVLRTASYAAGFYGLDFKDHPAKFSFVLGDISWCRPAEFTGHRHVIRIGLQSLIKEVSVMVPLPDGTETATAYRTIDTASDRRRWLRFLVTVAHETAHVEQFATGRARIVSLGNMRLLMWQGRTGITLRQYAAMQRIRTHASRIAYASVPLERDANIRGLTAVRSMLDEGGDLTDRDAEQFDAWLRYAKDPESAPSSDALV